MVLDLLVENPKHFLKIIFDLYCQNKKTRRRTSLHSQLLNSNRPPPQDRLFSYKAGFIASTSSQTAQLEETRRSRSATSHQNSMSAPARPLSG